VDSAIRSPFGASRQGQPLSFNRAPSPDLAPWVARLYVSVIDAPPEHVIRCGMFYDIGVFRLQLSGEWTAMTADGLMEMGRSAVFMGPQTRLMPVTVRGGYVSIGFSMRPGVGHALQGLDIHTTLDRIIYIENMGLPGEMALNRLAKIKSADKILTVLEDMIRATINHLGARRPDPVSVQFETATLTNPAFSVADFAEELGISQRGLERIVRRDFGMSPKQVQKRARALDMAARLRGVADEDETAELLLRYYDQSHLIREFTDLFGMPPGQFVTAPQPILTIALESRQARRLEAIERLKPGEKRPWQ